MSPSTRMAVRLYRRLVAFYADRAGDADAMVETFELRMREATGRGVFRGAGVAIREYAGLLRAAAGTRLYRASRGGSGVAYERELRYAVRRLRRSPVFTATTIVTLALGIGANTAVFSVVNGILLSSLPYEDPDRLVLIDHGGSGIDLAQGLGMTSGLFHYYRARSENLASIAIWEGTASGDEWTLLAERGPVPVQGIRVVETLADVLGIHPIAGRWLTEADRRENRGVAVISHRLWQQVFGGTADAVGSMIRLEGVPREIIGVMPQGFSFPVADTDVWLPYPISGSEGFGGFQSSGIGRLAPGVSLDALRRELDHLIPLMPGAIPDPFATSVVEDAGLFATPVFFKDDVVGDVRATLLLLMGTMAVLLSLACANTANLLLVRAESSRRERAIRTALGADRRALRRPALAESMLLASTGGAAGVLVAFAALEVALAIAPPTIPRLDTVRIDGTAIAFSGALAFLVMLAFTVLPRITGSQNVTDALRASGRVPSAEPRATRARQTLATGQIALALVLLIGAGLMMRSLWNLRQVNPGFAVRDALTFGIDLPVADYPARDDAVQFSLALLDRLHGVPGVEAAGAVGRCLPFGGWCGGDPLSVRGRAAVPGEIPPIVALRTATPGYFDIMGIPLRSGRVFTEADQRQGGDVVVVSEQLARRYFGNADPLGQGVHDRFRDGSTWYTIIGVVGDVPARSLTEEGAPMIYFPLRSTDGRGASANSLDYVIRTAVPPLSIAGAVRAAVAEIDSRIVVAHVTTLRDYVDDQSRATAFTMWLLAVAAGLAVLLGAIGVFGVNSYLAATRRGEFGLRLALGARRADVGRLVLVQATRMVAAGLAAGLLASVAASRVMSSLLFGVDPVDPVTYAAVAAGLTAVALIAVLIPATRAARIDPIETLRD